MKGKIYGLLNQSNELRDEAVVVAEALAGADLEEKGISNRFGG